jgi:hypothetical protein
LAGNDSLCVTVLVVWSILDAELSRVLATQSSPGAVAMVNGPAPTAIVATAVRRRMSTRVTVFPV